MHDLIERSDLILRLEKQADYDAQPRACRRMIRAVQSFPSVRAVPEEVFLSLLNRAASLPPEEKRMWKEKAGLI